MIRKKLLFVPFLAVLLGFSGCLDDDGNYTTVPDFAVVGNNSQMGGTTLRTSRAGEVAAPSLTGYVTGDCAYVNFKIDYDNQPSETYWTATEIESIKIEQKNLNVISTDDEVFFDSYILPFSGLGYYSSYMYNGRFFLEMGYKANVGEKVTYEVFCNPEEKDSDGVFSIYLRGKFTESENYDSNNSVVDIYAFDASQLIYRYGTSTTEDDVTYLTLKVYFKYFEKLDDDGNPVYKQANSTVYTLYMLR